MSNDQKRDELVRELVVALEKIRKTIKDSDAWWMDCPDRGGFDTEEIDAVLAKAKATDAGEETRS